MVSTPLRLGMVCPVSSGAIAIIVSAEDDAKEIAQNPLVRISAFGSISDGYLGGTRRDFSRFEVVELLARRVFRESEVLEPRRDIDVVEIFTLTAQWNSCCSRHSASALPGRHPSCCGLE